MTFSTELPTLILPIGLPRSGKSTWARKQGYPIVCPDEIRLALTGQPFIAQLEPFVWYTTKIMVKALFGSGHSTVILDATNTIRRYREEWKSSAWKRHFVYIGGISTKSLCLERCNQIQDEKHRKDLKAVIEKMSQSFEWIETDELLPHDTCQQ